MNLNYRNATEALPDLMRYVLNYGASVPSRNGNTFELAMNQITLTDPWPLAITTPERKASIAAQIAETMWILAGRNDIGWLSAYLPQAHKFSDDGATWRGGYGPRIRAFGILDKHGDYCTQDQLQHVINLLQEDPNTRRAVISLYDPAIDTQPGKDIPCNNWLHFLPRGEKLDLHVAIRSNDLMWGWSGINAFEWGALLAIVAGLTGLKRGSLTFSISSLHLYERHFAKARRIEKAAGQQRVFNRTDPEFAMPATGWTLDQLIQEWFSIEALIRVSAEDESKLPDVTARIKAFPEPMMQSWLRVLAGWWHDSAPVALIGSPLGDALANGPKRKKAEAPAQAQAQASVASQNRDVQVFLNEANALHAEKDAAYGASWMARGEQMAIMANIARKVDRLGANGGGDTAFDTALDLMVYLAKYSDWLGQGEPEASEGTSTGDHHCSRVRHLLHHFATESFPMAKPEVSTLEQAITERFALLERAVKRDDARRDQVDALGVLAFRLALILWTEQGVPAEEVKPVCTACREHVSGNHHITDEQCLFNPARLVVSEQEFLGNHAERNQTRFFDGYNV